MDINKYSHIIWDFNGTLLDDLQAEYNTVNVLLSRRKLKQFDSVDEYRAVFRFPIIDYYKDIGFDFEKESYKNVADEWGKEYNKQSALCGVNSGIVEALEYFKTCGMSQLVLSATWKSLLQKQIEPLGISGYFEELLALDDLLAHSKVELGKLWFERVKPKGALFIGDTVHDFETAEAIGVDCVLVCTGHQSRERLEKCGVPVFETIDELVYGFKHPLAQKAVEYFEQGYNCSQAVLCSASESLGLEKEMAAKLAAPFGGGVGRKREICGACSGMLMATGLFCGYSTPETGTVKAEHYALVRKLCDKFKEKNGSIICREIMGEMAEVGGVPSERNSAFYKERPCVNCVRTAGEILEDLLRGKAL